MFSRIGNMFRGFIGLFVSGIERRNPEALLEVEQENLRRQMGKFNVGLASHAGMVERLIGQIRKLEDDESNLRAKTAANIKLGGRGTIRAAAADDRARTGRKPRATAAGRIHLPGTGAGARCRVLHRPEQDREP